MQVQIEIEERRPYWSHIQNTA